MILSTTQEKPSLAGGEVAPELRWRRDLSRYATSVAAQENMVTLLTGGAKRRSGTRNVLPFRDETETGVSVKFELDRTDSYLCHFNGGYVRFIRGGGFLENLDGTPYEIAHPFGASDLDYIRGGVQDGNTLYLACRGYRPKLLTRSRTNALDWSFSDYAVTPVDTQNLDTTRTLQASAPTGAIGIEANTDTFEAADAGTNWRLDEPDLTLVAQWKADETGLSVGDERRYNGNVYRVVSGADSGPNPPTHTDGEVSSGDGNVTWQYRHSTFGLVLIDTVTDARHVTATVLSLLPDSVVSQATYRWWPSAWSDAKGWPEIAQNHQNRLCWFRGDRHWLTQPLEFTSFDVNGTDDDAIIGRLRPQDGSLALAEWAASSGALIVGTRGGEWVFGTSSGDRTLTDLNINPECQGSDGSAPHTPELVDGGVIFIGKSQERLHFAKYDPGATLITVNVDEITKACGHLLKGKAKALAFQRDPYRILWVSTEAGELVALTFQPKEDLIAAHRHPMANAFVEDLETVPSPDGTASDLYLFVRRTINGVTRRFIEQLQPFFEPVDRANPTAEGAWFVDCGLQYIGAPVTEISGAEYLEGQTVAIHADGAMHARKTVVDGAITLDRAASNVIVGLPMPWRVETLPFETDTPKGSSKGKTKRANHVGIDMVNSAEGAIAVNGGKAEAIFETGAADYGAPIALRSASVQKTVESPGAIECTIEISGDGTMPVTIAGINPNLDVSV